ncbi:hypothetical protein N566_11570 [Streptomycetaceae bacterium MP113-05]|nr:hypothetical protein N566_11570 [Streptomycetaceae bacterium MP113-05]
MTARLGEVPSGCRERLIAHYGPSVEDWLARAPSHIVEAARRWEVALSGYHDAGHASAIAVGTALDGSPVILKAWVDPVRYRHELAALRAWAGGPAAGVVAAADDLAVAALTQIGGRPGGAGRPERESQRVAAVIQELHTLARRRPGSAVPSLADFLHEVVVPRVRHRARTLNLGASGDLVEMACRGLGNLCEDTTRRTVLHADLYGENVIFDGHGHPCLIDPHPMLGDAVFDWAFWTVHYDLQEGLAGRLATAARISHIPVPEITPWCRALAVDGLLYYMEIDDPARPKIRRVLSALMSADVGGQGR